MKRISLLLFVLLSLPACQPAPTHFAHKENIVGIDHELWIDGADDKSAQRASNAVFAELRLLSKFTQPVNSKPMSRTNILLRSGEWFSVNPSMTGILKESKKYYELTNGLFNPAGLGALRQAWRFYADPDMPKPPADAELQALLKDLPTMEDIQFDAIRSRGKNKRIRIDFDYLAYGYAIDTEIQHLQDMGVQNARIQIHGLDRVIGTVDSAGQRSAPATCTRSIPLYSGKNDSRQYNDILDLKTGLPVKNVQAIKVAADTASNAAVACWALLVSDSSAWPQLVTQLHVTSATITDANGEIHKITQ